MSVAVTRQPDVLAVINVIGNEYEPVEITSVTGSFPFEVQGPVDWSLGSVDVMRTVEVAVVTGFQKASVILTTTWKLEPANCGCVALITPRESAPLPGTVCSPGRTSCSREGMAATTLKVDCAVVSTGAQVLLSTTNRVEIPDRVGLALEIV